jgi:hypothetical protein
MHCSQLEHARMNGMDPVNKGKLNMIQTEYWVMSLLMRDTRGGEADTPSLNFDTNDQIQVNRFFFQ